MSLTSTCGRSSGPLAAASAASASAALPTTVTTAATAEEAVRAVESERPDVLVSDIGMPGEDGYSLIGRVRALGPERGGRTPALALTAYARAEDRVRAVFQTHVVKPVEPAELITMVASLAGRTSG